MNDHEYAALAAGYEIDSVARKYFLCAGKGTMNNPRWNPLESDADAFRLMVDAGIEVEWTEDGVSAVFYNSHKGIGYRADITSTAHSDKHAATRKAIFDCAVAIGKAMKEQPNDT